MINGREETIYGNEKEFSNRNEEKKFTFSNWEEKRKAEREISASKEDGTHETGEFTWTPPDEEETVYKDDPKVVAPYQKKNEPKNNRKTKTSLTYPVKRFAATIVFAVLLGTGLGLFALNLATHKEGVPASGSLGADAENGQTVKAGDSGAEEKKSGEKIADKRENLLTASPFRPESFRLKKERIRWPLKSQTRGMPPCRLPRTTGFM